MASGGGGPGTPYVGCGQPQPSPDPLSNLILYHPSKNHVDDYPFLVGLSYKMGQF